MFNEGDVEGVQKNFFRALINTYQFFSLYANIDGYTGGEEKLAAERRPEIDQWILAELQELVATVRDRMDAYDLTPAARAIQDFTIDQLSNWYVRRNRRRFWKGEMNEDKRSAYQTLHECLLTVSQLMCPVAPFLAEMLYRKLAVKAPDNTSVHLAILPQPGAVNARLKTKMRNAQRTVYLTRGLREAARIKTRQPLARILIATNVAETVEDIQAMRAVILEETNIKDIEFIPSDSDILRKKAKPNFKVLGPKFGKLMKRIAAAVQELDLEAINTFERTGHVSLSIDGEQVTLSTEDIEVQHQDIAGWTIGTNHDLVVALDTTLSDELSKEGHAREFVSKIQNLRKSSGFEVTDRVVITYQTESDELRQAIENTESYICSETLAVKLLQAHIPSERRSEITVNELPCTVLVSPVLPE